MVRFFLITTCWRMQEELLWASFSFAGVTILTVTCWSPLVNLHEDEEHPFLLDGKFLPAEFLLGWSSQIFRGTVGTRQCHQELFDKGNIMYSKLRSITRKFIAWINIDDYKEVSIRSTIETSFTWPARWICWPVQHLLESWQILYGFVFHVLFHKFDMALNFLTCSMSDITGYLTTHHTKWRLVYQHW